MLLDGNKLAEGHAYFEMGGVAHSHDHRLLAYGVDDKGSEFHTLKLRDLERGEDLPDEVGETTGSGVWSAVRRMAVLHPAGRKSPAPPHLPAPRRHPRQRGCAGL